MCNGRTQAYKAGWTAALYVCLTDKITAASEGDGAQAPSCSGLNDSLISHSNYGTYLRTPRKCEC